MFVLLKLSAFVAQTFERVKAHVSAEIVCFARKWLICFPCVLPESTVGHNNRAPGVLEKPAQPVAAALECIRAGQEQCARPIVESIDEVMLRLYDAYRRQTAVGREVNGKPCKQLGRLACPKLE